MYNISCLIEELRKLKESSKEAVENLDSFSEYKEYMHIKRDIQDELVGLLKQANACRKSQLILLCGGVGDGKSHLLSYLSKKTDILDEFKIHNDATESFEPTKTSIDTLNEVLNDFSDENLNKGSSKLILAINLGALNNFIDSKYSSRFTRLKEYVDEKGILESLITENSYDNSSNFQHLNFSDYHMFTLTNEGARSEYIKNLINKVTTDNDKNPFCNAYKSTCLRCDYKQKCLISDNYELLMTEKVKDFIIEILIEAMIKERLILSTRSILNFIYDIVVPNLFDNFLYEDVIREIKKMSISKYLDNIMPNYIFEHKDLSNIFEVLSKLDPIERRTEELDNLIIRFNTTENIAHMFNMHVDMPNNWYISGIINDKDKLINIMENEDNSNDKLIKFFIRLHRFSPINGYLSFNDKVYNEYVKGLYFLNKGCKTELKSLYDCIKDAIYKWNGASDIDSINIFLGRNQTQYKISQKLSLSPNVSDLNINEDEELYKFIPYLILEFKRESGSKIYEINIDFSLYRLLIKVIEGYRPNKKDKSNYVNFVEFMEKALELGEQNKELFFEEKMGFANNVGKYRLRYDDEFENYSFVEM